MAVLAKENMRSAFDILERGHSLISRKFVYGGHKRGLPVFYVGVESVWEGGEAVSGVGVNISREQAFFSAVLELIERLSLAGLPKKSALSESNVNGSGIAFSKEEAIAFGICECVERDALLLRWFSMAPPHRIEPAGIDDAESKILLSEAQKIGVEPHILDITSDIPVPAYLVMFIGGEPRTISFGSSVNPDPAAAVRKALYEAWGNYILNLLIADRPDFLERSNSQAKERYTMWRNPSLIDRCSFLLAGELVPLRCCEHNANELKTLKAILADRGFSVDVYESCHTLLKETGLYSAKVSIAGLLPFYFREENARFALGHPRLQGRIRNTYPHPFA